MNTEVQAVALQCFEALREKQLVRPLVIALGYMPEAFEPRDFNGQDIAITQFWLDAKSKHDVESFHIYDGNPVALERRARAES